MGPAHYVVAVGGEADPAAVKDALYPLAGHAGAAVVVDLQSVPVVGPSLLGILTGAAHLLRSCRGELVVVTRHPRVRSLLDDAGLSQLARIERTLDEAIGDGNAG